MVAGRSATTTTTIGKWLLAAVVPASAIFIGSLLTPVLIVMTVLAAAACVLLWLDAPSRSSRASRWVLVAFAVLLGATVLQAIPLPAGVVATLAPTNADVWARALAPLREDGPAWHTLSLAPAATRVEILRGVFYGCVFLGALRVAVSDGGPRFLERVVIASASLVALSTLAHAGVHAETVFGIYRPRDTQGYIAGRIGPLLNPNHVAAYLNVGACVAAGVALTDRRPMWRVVAIAATILLAGTSVWAGSRGGTGSLLVGALLVGGLAFYRRRRYATGQAEAVVVLVALMAAGVLVGLSASDVARDDLGGLDVSKLQIIKTGFRLVPLGPLAGVGRGAFETMFPLVREGTTYMTFIRAENIVVQWLTEWGVPAALVGFGALAYALRPSVVLTAARPAIGAWVAVTVAVLHDLVDFHLEIPGVVALVALCVAAVVGGGAVSSERGVSPRVRSLPRLAAFACAPAALVAVVVVLPGIGHTLAEDRDAVARSAVQRSLSQEAFRDELRSAMLRYPAEPFLPLAGAIRAQATGEESVVPWIARALERYPTFGRAHLVLARSLAPTHRAQARLEYRLAYVNDVNVRPFVIREAPFVVDDRDSALELVTDGKAGNELLESLAAALVDRLPATSVALDEELTRRDPAATGPLRRRVRAANLDLAHDHVWCEDRDACTDEAIAAADQLIAREPDKCEPRVLLARLQIAAGRTGRALDDLTRAIETTAERGECLRALVSLCLETGERRRADAALDLATRSGCGTRDECIGLYAWAASTEESRGNTVRAISFHKRASEMTPDHDEHLKRVAELSDKAGLVGEAIDAYAKLAVRHPDDAQWRVRADELRLKSQEQRFRNAR